MRNTLRCIVALSLMAHVAMAEDFNAGKPQKKFKGPVKVFILAGQSNMEGHGGACRARYRDKMITLDTKAGQNYRLNSALKISNSKP